MRLVLLPEAGGLVLGPSQGSHAVDTSFGQGVGAEGRRNQLFFLATLPISAACGHPCSLKLDHGFQRCSFRFSISTLQL